MTPPLRAGGGATGPEPEPRSPGRLLGNAVIYWALWALAGACASSLVASGSAAASGDAALLERRALGALLTAAVPLGFAWLCRHALPWLGPGGARALARVPLWYVPFFAAWVPLSLFLYPRVLESLGGALRAQPELEYFTRAPASLAGGAVMVVLVCAAAPLVEEVLFRGYLQTAARQVMPKWPAIIVAALPFGLIHGVSYAFPVGILGVFFGWVRERTGGVGGAIAAHAVHNTVAVALTAAFPDVFRWLYR